MMAQADAQALPGASLTLAELANEYFSQYAGRDDSRPQRLRWWIARLGARAATSITDDDVFAALEDLAASPARQYAGRDIDGRRIYRARAKSRSASTINRYHVALAALFTWGMRRRRLPRGFENPCRKIERPREPAGVVRFLSGPEREALLEACRASSWKRLYLLVLMAVTTGARRGELMALLWRDLDLERASAYICTTKNGDRRVLPLTAAVLAELERFKGLAGQLVFPSPRKASQPFNFEKDWRVARDQAKLKDFRFHDLRHTCASYLAQNGASLLEIADVLGHRQLAMTKRYAHLTTTSKTNLVNRVLGDIR